MKSGNFALWLTSPTRFNAMCSSFSHLATDCGISCLWRPWHHCFEYAHFCLFIYWWAFNWFFFLGRKMPELTSIPSPIPLHDTKTNELLRARPLVLLDSNERTNPTPRRLPDVGRLLPSFLIVPVIYNKWFLGSNQKEWIWMCPSPQLNFKTIMIKVKKTNQKDKVYASTYTKNVKIGDTNQQQQKHTSDYWGLVLSVVWGGRCRLVEVFGITLGLVLP